MAEIVRLRNTCHGLFGDSGPTRLLESRGHRLPESDLNGDDLAPRLGTGGGSGNGDGAPVGSAAVLKDNCTRLFLQIINDPRLSAQEKYDKLAKVLHSHDRLAGGPGLDDVEEDDLALDAVGSDAAESRRSRRRDGRRIVEALPTDGGSFASAYAAGLFTPRPRRTRPGLRESGGRRSGVDVGKITSGADFAKAFNAGAFRPAR